MGFNVVNYSLSNSYTDESILGISGVLAGKNCVIEKIEYDSGSHIVHFKWTADDGTERRELMRVDDGDNIYSFYPNTLYHVDDIVIYEGSLYRCTVEHRSGSTLDTTKFDSILSSDGNYSLHDNYGELNQSLKPADRKMAYCINDYIAPGGMLYRKGYYLWNGSSWVRTQPEVLDRFTELIEYESDGVTIKNIDLFFDGKKVITEEDQTFAIVNKYSDIDTTLEHDVVYFVTQPTTDSKGDIEHFSGEYYFNHTDKTVECVQDRETKDIDFLDPTEYKQKKEGGTN